MNLCEDNHEEICFEGRVCPACNMRDYLQSTIDDLEKEVSSLEKQLEERE